MFSIPINTCGLLFLLFTEFSFPSLTVSQLISLTLSSPQQATNSTAIVSCTVIPPRDRRRVWNIEWSFRGSYIGYTGLLYTTPISSLDTTEHSNRLSFSIDLSKIDQDTSKVGFTRHSLLNNHRKTYSNSSSSHFEFKAELIINQLQASDNEAIVKVRAADGTRVNASLKVRDCNSSLPNNVKVESSSNIFKSSGRFVCNNNKSLTFANGSSLPSIVTTCLASAEWENQNGLHCWSAPSVSLSGDFSITEGTYLSLKCDYENLVPSGLFSLFYVGDRGYIREKNKSFTVMLQRTDNDKIVSCQAVTPFTQLYNSTGRSTRHVLNVKYASYQVTPTSCVWIANQRGRCDIAFNSNPSSLFTSLNKQGSSITNDGSEAIISSKDTSQIFAFIRNKVTESDNGTYELTLYTPTVSSRKILFEVKVAVVVNATKTKLTHVGENYSTVVDELTGSRTGTSRTFTVTAVINNVDKSTKDQSSTMRDGLAVSQATITEAFVGEQVDGSPVPSHLLVLLSCIIIILLIMTIVFAVLYFKERHKKKETISHLANEGSYNNDNVAFNTDNGGYVEFRSDQQHTHATTVESSLNAAYVDMSASKSKASISKEDGDKVNPSEAKPVYESVGSLKGAESSKGRAENTYV